MPRKIDSAESTFSLSRFVEDIRALAPVAGRVARVDRLPDGRTTLIVRVIEEGRSGDVTVVGPRTRALLKNPPRFARALLVRFKPGWSSSLFGVAAHTLTDRFVPLEDIWGRSAGDVSLALREARSAAEVLDRLSRAITLRAEKTFESASARLARRAVGLLEGDQVRVESVADQLGVTARHLRRAFAEHIGIAPKEFARSVRLQRALRMAATSSDWGRIAAHAGYYDQAHLSADFRQLIGITPSAFMKRAGDLQPP